MTLEDVILSFLRDLKTKLCKHNQKKVESVHYIKVYTKGVLKNGFVYVETSGKNLLYQLRSRRLTHQTDFDLKYTQDIFYFTVSYCLIYVPLYTKFKALAFRSLCLVPNKIILFFLGWNVHLIYYQQTSHTNLRDLLVVAFQFQLHFYAGKLCKYYLHKVTSHWQQLGASNL